MLALLVGLGGGALLTRQNQTEPLLEEERVVLFEAANAGFPVAGGAFAPSFYNESTGRCELDKFQRYMEDNPDRKAAWKEIRGLSEPRYDELMDRLTQAIVTKHTPVTNHGYRDGRWFPVNSVLAPGTPVMIDPESIERGTGSFLARPEPTDFVEETPEPTATDFVEETPEPTATDFVEESPEPTDESDTPEPDRDEETFVIVVKCTCGNPITDPKCPPNCGNELVTPTPSPSDDRGTSTPRETATSTPAETRSPTPTDTKPPQPTDTRPPTEEPTEEPEPTDPQDPDPPEPLL